MSRPSNDPFLEWTTIHHPKITSSSPITKESTRQLRNTRRRTREPSRAEMLDARDVRFPTMNRAELLRVPDPFARSDVRVDRNVDGSFDPLRSSSMERFPPPFLVSRERRRSPFRDGRVRRGKEWCGTNAHARISPSNALSRERTEGWIRSRVGTNGSGGARNLVREEALRFAGPRTSPSILDTMGLASILSFDPPPERFQASIFATKPRAEDVSIACAMRGNRSRRRIRPDEVAHRTHLSSWRTNSSWRHRVLPFDGVLVVRQKTHEDRVSTTTLVVRTKRSTWIRSRRRSIKLFDPKG